MKKQIARLTVKTDKIVALTQTQANGINAGLPNQWPEPTGTCSQIFCPSTLR